MTLCWRRYKRWGTIIPAFSVAHNMLRLRSGEADFAYQRTWESFSVRDCIDFHGYYRLRRCALDSLHCQEIEIAHREHHGATYISAYPYSRHAITKQPRRCIALKTRFPRSYHDQFNSLTSRSTHRKATSLLIPETLLFPAVQFRHRHACRQ